MIKRMIVALSLLGLCAPSHAESTPQPVRADKRIRKVVFDKDNVVFLVGTLGTSTMIVFGDDERIATVAIGDSLSWQAVPDQSNRFLFIKPLERDAVTNMNVVTNRHIYNFEMRAMAPGNANAVYKLQFIYPDDLADAKLLDKAKAMAAWPNLAKLKGHPELANFDYGFKGSALNKPEGMFDDGVHTYFQFGGEVPAVFLVKPDRSETLVNYRKEGDWLVVDEIAAQFTLRNGDEATCIFNLHATLAPPAQKDMALVQPLYTPVAAPMPPVKAAKAVPTKKPAPDGVVTLTPPALDVGATTGAADGAQ